MKRILLMLLAGLLLAGCAPESPSSSGTSAGASTPAKPTESNAKPKTPPADPG